MTDNSSATTAALKQTPLNSAHRSLGGRMVDFGGWDMPVLYTLGTLEEHLRTRHHAGLFDVSHMGEIDVRGADAIPFINRITSNDCSKLVDGQAHYSAFTTPAGTVIDDLLVYRFNEQHLMLVVNASTTEKDWQWVNDHLQDETVELTNRSQDFCQIAVQGPDAVSICQQLTQTPLDTIKYYHFREGEFDNTPAIISRTGYTGEDGFEIYAAADQAERLWNRILETGKADTPTGIAPCGLGARNTLRLEAAMSLYGHEIDETTTLLEANLGWICKLNKGDFIGREALQKQKDEGLKRKLVGFETTERGIARDGQTILLDGQQVGQVTSGSPAPYLKKNIGLGYVPVEYANVGQEAQVEVRGRSVGIKIVPTPFYKRQK